MVLGTTGLQDQLKKTPVKLLRCSFPPVSYFILFLSVYEGDEITLLLFYLFLKLSCCYMFKALSLAETGEKA